MPESPTKPNKLCRNRRGWLVAFLVPFVLVGGFFGIRMFWHGLGDVGRWQEITGDMTALQMQNNFLFAALVWLVIGTAAGGVGSAVYWGMTRQSD